MPHHLKLLKKKLLIFYFKTTPEKAEIVLNISHVPYLLNRQVKIFFQSEARDQKMIP